MTKLLQAMIDTGSAKTRAEAREMLKVVVARTYRRETLAENIRRIPGRQSGAGFGELPF